MCKVRGLIDRHWQSNTTRSYGWLEIARYSIETKSHSKKSPRRYFGPLSISTFLSLILIMMLYVCCSSNHRYQHRRCQQLHGNICFGTKRWKVKQRNLHLQQLATAIETDQARRNGALIPQLLATLPIIQKKITPCSSEFSDNKLPANYGHLHRDGYSTKLLTQQLFILHQTLGYASKLLQSASCFSSVDSTK